MNTRVLCSLVICLTLAGSGTIDAGEAGANSMTNLLKTYTGKAQPPASVLQAYAHFVELAEAEDWKGIVSMALPYALTFTTKPRSGTGEEPLRGLDINLPFMKSRFDKYIMAMGKISTNCWQVQTGTTGLSFVETKDEGWKLYRYEDIPIR